jgi:hypothetical protein
VLEDESGVPGMGVVGQGPVCFLVFGHFAKWVGNRHHSRTQARSSPSIAGWGTSDPQASLLGWSPPRSRLHKWIRICTDESGRRYSGGPHIRSNRTVLKGSFKGMGGLPPPSRLTALVLGPQTPRKSQTAPGRGSGETTKIMPHLKKKYMFKVSPAVIFGRSAQTRPSAPQLLLDSKGVDTETI